jgi:hypothetical protein
MQRKFTVRHFLGFIGAAAIVGCAVGSDPETEGTSELATLPVEAGKGDDEASVKLPPKTKSDDDAGNEDDGGRGGGGGGGGGGMDAGGGGGGKDAGTDAGGGGGGGGGGAACASPNTCAGATDLGSISGDTGADTKTAQGSGSQWFKVRVTEDDSSIFAVPLIAKAELTSPPGTNFDVYVYVAGSSSGQECSAVSASSTTTGFDSAKVEFGESGTFSNGVDDSRTVTVEVRWVSGACSPGAKWSLTVRGDTP